MYQTGVQTVNKRIEELAEQAGYKPLPGFDFANSLEETYLKKFAELIVKECCDVLYDNEMGGYQVNYVLKEHFGVEE